MTTVTAVEHWHNRDSQIGATARAQAKRTLARHAITIDNRTRDNPAAIETILRANPKYAALSFIACVETAAKNWEIGNNSGDSRKLEESLRYCDRFQNAAEVVAALFGCTLSWPGLYPVLKDAGGAEHDGSSDMRSVFRAFTGNLPAEASPD